MDRPLPTGPSQPAPVHELLASGVGLREAGRRLGTTCLRHAGWISTARTEQTNREPLERLELMLRSVEATWTAIATGRAPLRTLLDLPGLADDLAALDPALQALVVLRPLCRYGLGWWFAATTDVVPLRYGDPFPIAERTLPALRGTLTPAAATTHAGDLLDRTGFRIWPHPDGARIGAELDYSARERLEAIVGGATRGVGRLPVVATIHPYRGWDELAVETRSGAFFHVRPRAFRPDWIHAALARCGTADIAVLPELSLPAPDALGPALAARGAARPRIVVAGSAHVTHRDRTRSNTSITYIDGRPALRHDKVRAMVHRPPGGGAVREDLTAGRAVVRCLSSRSTRLAVVICADLNDHEVPGLLRDLGVNLLLVPALTPHEGAFVGAVAHLASSCQAVSVVVNGSPPPARRRAREPFMVLAGVPRHDPQEQVRSFGPPPSGRRAIGMLDANERLSRSQPWGPGGSCGVP